MHRVAQPTLLHQALHVGDLFRDGSSRCPDLIHHESRMQLRRLVQCQSTQLTYRNETEVCNACLWRLERSWWLSHDDLQCTKWRQFRSALPLDIQNVDPTKAFHIVGGVGRCQDGSACARGFCHQARFLLLFCCKSNHKTLYLKLSHRCVILRRSLSVFVLLFVLSLLVCFHDLWLAIIKLTLLLHNYLSFLGPDDLSVAR